MNNKFTTEEKYIANKLNYYTYMVRDKCGTLLQRNVRYGI